MSSTFSPVSESCLGLFRPFNQGQIQQKQAAPPLTFRVLRKLELGPWSCLGQKMLLLSAEYHERGGGGGSGHISDQTGLETSFGAWSGLTQTVRH